MIMDYYLQLLFGIQQILLVILKIKSFMRLIIDNNKKNNIFPNKQIKKNYNNLKV